VDEHLRLILQHGQGCEQDKRVSRWQSTGVGALWCQQMLLFNSKVNQSINNSSFGRGRGIKDFLTESFVDEGLLLSVEYLLRTTFKLSQRKRYRALDDYGVGRSKNLSLLGA
jgi:hypothetical protein